MAWVIPGVALISRSDLVSCQGHVVVERTRNLRLGRQSQARADGMGTLVPCPGTPLVVSLSIWRVISIIGPVQTKITFFLQELESGGTGFRIFLLGSGASAFCEGL